MVVKKGRGFNITVDNTENAFLVEDMKKWVLHRKVDFNQYYNPNDTISTRYTDLIIQLNNSWNYLKQIYLKENTEDFKMKF